MLFEYLLTSADIMKNNISIAFCSEALSIHVCVFVFLVDFTTLRIYDCFTYVDFHFYLLFVDDIQMNRNHRYIRLTQDENTFDIEEEIPVHSHERVSIFIFNISTN